MTKTKQELAIEITMVVKTTNSLDSCIKKVVKILTKEGVA